MEGNVDIDELAHLRGTLRVLRKATGAFSAATDDYPRLLDSVASHLAEGVGDACALFLLSDDGHTLSLATLSSSDAPFVHECRKVLEAPMSVAARPPWQHVLVTGEPLLVPKLDPVYAANSAPAYVDLIARTGIHSSLVVPLRLHGLSIGLLVLSRFRSTSRPYDYADQELAEVVADQAALAIGSARAYAAERAARAAEAMATANAEHVRERGRLAALVDASDDAIIGKTLEGTVTSWNRGAQAIFGYSAAEMVGQSIRVLIPPGRENEETEILATLAEGNGRSFETLRRRKDGRDIDVAVTISPLRDAAGSVIGVAKVVRDITERKRAEAVAARSKDVALAERLRTVTDLAQVGMVMVGADRRYRYANQSYAHILRIPSADIVGQRVADVLPTLYESQIRPRLDRAFAGERVSYELLLSVPGEHDGRCYAVSYEPSVDAGEPIVVVVLVDMTERKRVVEALALREAQLSLFIAHSPVALAMFDREMTYVAASRRWLSDYGLSEDIVGKSHYEVFSSVPERWKEAHARALEGAVERSDADSFVRSDGRDAWLRWEIRPWRTPRGDIGGIVIFTEDITQERRLAEQFRQAQKMEAVGRLAGGVAHDFNNMLTVILSYSEMLLEGKKPSDPEASDIEEIRKAALRATDLTRQLLMFSRQQVVEPKVLDLNELLTGLEKMLKRILGEDIDLVVTPQVPLGRVKADPSSVEQVVMNLVVNARDAMPTGGRLSIETANVILDAEYAKGHLGSSPGRHVMLAVTDTGVGMDQATQARIFEPFFTTKAAGKGTGLGLSTVFGIAQQCGGSVWVYSEPGKGTTFKVYFPQIEAMVDLLPPSLSPVTLRGSETILLVEDQEQVRVVALGILNRNGYRVLVAENAGEALLLCETHEGVIHLLLTDVVMPGMSGAELAKRLATTRPDLRVVCMSGYTDDSVVRHGVLESGVAFLQKPFTPESLTRKVREVLNAPRKGGTVVPPKPEA